MMFQGHSECTKGSEAGKTHHYYPATRTLVTLLWHSWVPSNFKTRTQAYRPEIAASVRVYVVEVLCSAFFVEHAFIEVPAADKLEIVEACVLILLTVHERAQAHILSEAMDDAVLLQTC